VRRSVVPRNTWGASGARVLAAGFIRQFSLSLSLSFSLSLSLYLSHSHTHTHTHTQEAEGNVLVSFGEEPLLAAGRQAMEA